MTNKDDYEIINEIVEAELDGMELDALCDYFQDSRRESLEKIDRDTLDNILAELNLDVWEPDDAAK